MVFPSAHKAANPERYPLQDAVRTLYPPLVNIEGRYKPTKVHLQVYDGKPFQETVEFDMVFTRVAQTVLMFYPSYSHSRLPPSSVLEPLQHSADTSLEWSPILQAQFLRPLRHQACHHQILCNPVTI